MTIKARKLAELAAAELILSVLRGDLVRPFRRALSATYGDEVLAELPVELARRVAELEKERARLLVEINELDH